MLSLYSVNFQGGYNLRAKRTSPLVTGQLTQLQIIVALECLMYGHLFLQSGDMAEDSDVAMREIVLVIDRRLVAVTISLFQMNWYYLT